MQEPLRLWGGGIFSGQILSRKKPSFRQVFIQIHGNVMFAA